MTGHTSGTLTSLDGQTLLLWVSRGTWVMFSPPHPPLDPLPQAIGVLSEYLGPWHPFPNEPEPFSLACPGLYHLTRVQTTLSSLAMPDSLGKEGSQDQESASPAFQLCSVVPPGAALTANLPCPLFLFTPDPLYS